MHPFLGTHRLIFRINRPRVFDFPSAYADFLPIESALGVHSDGPVDTSGLAPFPLELSSGLKETPIGKKRYTLVRILCDEERFGTLRDTMASIGVTGMTVTNVMGCGTQKGESRSIPWN